MVYAPEDEALRPGVALERYVALLRGVNVGGKQLSMQSLRALLESLGYQHVTTYIQSGNAVFTGGDSGPPKPGRVEERIAAELQMNIRVIIRSQVELADVVDRNPFPATGEDSRTLHVTFLADEPSAEAVHGLAGESYAPDQFAIVGREVYLRCPEGYGRSKLGNAFWERRLGVAATTRNWNTVNTLLRMASA